jgi:hypothetical protein
MHVRKKMQVKMLATLNSMFDTSTCLLRVLHVENFCMLQLFCMLQVFTRHAWNMHSSVTYVFEGATCVLLN